MPLRAGAWGLGPGTWGLLGGLHCKGQEGRRGGVAWLSSSPWALCGIALQMVGGMGLLSNVSRGQCTHVLILM